MRGGARRGAPRASEAENRSMSRYRYHDSDRSQLLHRVNDVFFDRHGGNLTTSTYVGQAGCRLSDALGPVRVRFIRGRDRDTSELCSLELATVLPAGASGDSGTRGSLFVQQD